MVRAPDEPGVDLVVGPRPRTRASEAVPHLDALHGLNPHQGKGEPRVEPVGLLRVRAEAGRATLGDDLDDAAERVAVLAGASVASRMPSSPRAPPTSSGRPATVMPIVASSALATEPAATCVAVWRALARSSALRTSSWPYLRAIRNRLKGATR